eukprot:SAG31_NODE_1663_length_7581_cov_10.076399_3_plen_263_part_00
MKLAALSAATDSQLRLSADHALLLASAVLAWSCYVALTRELDTAASLSGPGQCASVGGRPLKRVKAAWLALQLLLAGLLVPVYFGSSQAAAVPPEERYSFVLQLVVTSAVAVLELYNCGLARAAETADSSPPWLRGELALQRDTGAENGATSTGQLTDPLLLERSTDGVQSKLGTRGEDSTSIMDAAGARHLAVQVCFGADFSHALLSLALQSALTCCVSMGTVDRLLWLWHADDLVLSQCCLGILHQAVWTEAVPAHAPRL